MSSCLLSSLEKGSITDPDTGKPLSGRLVWVYTRKTTSPVNVYQDDGLTIPYTQPLTTGADGTPGAVPGYVAANQSIDFLDILTGDRTQAEAVSAQNLALTTNPLQSAYVAKGGAMVLTDAAMTSGNGYVTSTAYTFTTADVGKYIAVQGAGAAGADFTPVLISGIYVDGRSALTGGVTAGTTVTNARCIVGFDDTAAIQSAANAVASSGGGDLEITGQHLVLSTANSAGGIFWAVGIAASHVHVVFRGQGKILSPKPSGAIFLISGGGKPSGLSNWATNRYIDATQYAITLPVAAGATSVTCTTAANAGNFAPGDYLYLFTGDPAGSPASAWYGTDAETFQVVSANATTGVIRLNRPTGKPYAQEYWPNASENTPTTTSVTAFPAPVGIAKVTDRTIADVQVVDFNYESWSLDRNAISSWQIEDMRLTRPRGRGYTGYSTGRDRTGYQCDEPRFHQVGAVGVAMPYSDCWASGDTDWTRVDAKITGDNFPPYLHCHEGGVRCVDKNASQIGASAVAATNGGSGAGHEFVGRWYGCRVLEPTYGANVYGTFFDGTGVADQAIVRDPVFMAAPTTATVRTGSGVRFDAADQGLGPANLGSALSSGSDRGRVGLNALSIDMAFNTGTRSLSQLPQFAVILGVYVIVYSQFNGAPTLSLGISGDAARYMGSFTIPTTAPSAEGSVVAAGAPAFNSVPAGTGTSPGVIPPSRAQPLATLTAGGATQGKLKIIITYILGGPSQ